MPLVEKRYAEALLRISEEKASLGLYQNELTTVVNIYNKESQLQEFLLNPEVNTETKKSVVKGIFRGNIQDNLLSFLLLLLDKGRIKFLPGIAEEFIRLADRKNNVLWLTIVSAAPLDESNIESIKEKYRKLYNAVSVKAQTNVDPGIIGGVKVVIGDKVIDGSVTGRLESLREILLGT